MSKILTLTIMVQFSVGCMFTANKENLMEALQEYNDGLRWTKVEWMVPHLPQKEREQLQEDRLDSEELKITGYDLASVKLKDSNHAIVLVRVDWYHLRQARLHTSVIEQTWSRDGQNWQVVQQRLTKGPPFPLIKTNAKRQAKHSNKST